VHKSTYDKLKKLSFELAPVELHPVNKDHYVFVESFPLPAGWEDDDEAINDAVSDEWWGLKDGQTIGDVSVTDKFPDGDWEDSDTEINLIGRYNGIINTDAKIRIYDIKRSSEFDTRRGLKRPPVVQLQDIVYVVDMGEYEYLQGYTESSGGMPIRVISFVFDDMDARQMVGDDDLLGVIEL
jgi:hypothetical protein